MYEGKHLLTYYKTMKTKILELWNYIINTWKRFDKETFAYDERIKDSRDLNISELAWSWEFENMPRKFEVQDWKFQNQDVDGYKMSCTAMDVTNCINNSHFIKKRPERYSWFDLFDIAVDLDLASRTNGAYTIHLIKLAKALGYIVKYYQCDTNMDSKLAIYKGLCVATGSNKIDWRKCRDWLVTEISTWPWHSFCKVWWDDDKIVGEYTGAFKCENSYWDKYQDKWCFWLPYALCPDILHNTRKAIYTKSTTAK